MILTTNNKNKKHKRKKDKEIIDTAPQKKQQKKSIDLRKNDYFFYRVEGHKKRSITPTITLGMLRKDILLNLVCFEINLISVPRHI